jgi:hypothetical protein
MAFTIINTTDTLEQMRVKLNSLTQNDFGDPALLATTGFQATSVMGAIVEVASYVTNTFAFTVKDTANASQLVGPGTQLRFASTTNQINAAVSSGPTVTFSLPNTVTVNNQINVGDLSLSNGSITSSSNNISFSNNNLSTTGTLGAGAITATSYTSSGNITINTNKFVVTGATGNTSVGGTLGVTGLLTSAGGIYVSGGNIQFEGVTANAFKTTLDVVDPTANRTITLPNVSGTVVTTGDVGTITSTMIADNTIVNSDIADTTIRGVKFNTSGDSVTFASVTATTFTGTASTAATIQTTPQETDNNSYYLPFVSSNIGSSQVLRTDTDLSYNPGTNILTTTALKAQYADLAEIYETDKIYDVGTVVMIGGEKEVTECFVGKRALGVISDRPAFLMNAKGKGQPIALKGRVKIKVTGPVKKGDELVAGNGGYATTISEEFTKVFAIALEDNDKGLIEAVIL